MAFLKFAFLLVAVAAAVSGNENSRVVGGNAVGRADWFPWNVEVRHSQTLVGGGALISDRWVLTSGKVVSGYPGVNRFSVFLGGLDIWNSPLEPGRIEIKCDYQAAHPNYRDTRDTHYSNNIGLLHLETPTFFYPNIQPIVMSRDAVLPATSGIVTGWGGTSTVSRYLQYVYVNTKDAQECVTSVGGRYIAGANICSRGTSTSCWYDHGSPLVTYSSTLGYRLVGVVSYAGCLDPNNPTLYSSLSHAAHMDFITSITGIVY